VSEVKEPTETEREVKALCQDDIDADEDGQVGMIIIEGNSQ
jgi:hypothetical protein